MAFSVRPCLDAEVIAGGSLLGVIETALLQSILGLCCEVCGVLALEMGTGSGAYHHPQTLV